MKINIFFKITYGPEGGGNQFLRALKEYFNSVDKYSDSPEQADVILFNSHQHYEDLIKLKHNFKDIIFVHRVDGPMKLYTNETDIRDTIVYKLNSIIADATIFQTEWSKKQNLDMGFIPTQFSKTIINAPCSNLFNREGKAEFSTDRKIKLVATSWSKNIKKGFREYKWLDDKLDFNKYEMTFIGRSPVTFNNIKHISPLEPSSLAAELKKNDIFITASQKDPCSNSLIEAMHCGLPAIALKDGGHIEIIKDSGEFFDRIEEVPVLINKIIANYNKYQMSINLPFMREVSCKYLDFIENLVEKVKRLEYKPKRVTRSSIKKIVWPDRMNERKTLSFKSNIVKAIKQFIP